MCIKLVNYWEISHVPAFTSEFQKWKIHVEKKFCIPVTYVTIGFVHFKYYELHVCLIVLRGGVFDCLGHCLVIWLFGPLSCYLIVWATVLYRWDAPYLLGWTVERMKIWSLKLISISTKIHIILNWNSEDRKPLVFTDVEMHLSDKIPGRTKI